MTESDEYGRLAHAVLGYLAEHPRAMDTLGGIAEWWIMRQRIRDEVAALERVLRRLVDQGVLEELQAGDDVCYRLTRRSVPPP